MTDARKPRDSTDLVPPTTAWVWIAGRMWPLSQVDWYTVGTAGEPRSISLRLNRGGPATG